MLKQKSLKLPERKRIRKGMKRTICFSPIGVRTKCLSQARVYPRRHWVSALDALGENNTEFRALLTKKLIKSDNNMNMFLDIQIPRISLHSLQKFLKWDYIEVPF